MQQARLFLSQHCRTGEAKLAHACREGEAGDNLYVIQSGTFEAVKELGAAEKVLFTVRGRRRVRRAGPDVQLPARCDRQGDQAVPSPLPSLPQLFSSSKNVMQTVMLHANGQCSAFHAWGRRMLQAVTDGILWAMDRSTFRTIVLAARVQKRARYEQVRRPGPAQGSLCHMSTPSSDACRDGAMRMAGSGRKSCTLMRERGMPSPLVAPIAGQCGATSAVDHLIAVC